MPDFSTQVFWHDNDFEEKVDPSNAVLSFVRAKTAARSARLLVKKQKYAKVGCGMLTYEPRLSTRCVISNVLMHLGTTPLSVSECDSIFSVISESSNEHVSGPMTAFITEACRRRGLVCRILEGVHKLTAGDNISQNSSAIILAARTTASAVGVCVAWKPGEVPVNCRTDGVGAFGSLLVQCGDKSVNEYGPCGHWHGRKRALSRISPKEVICLRISIPVGDMSLQRAPCSGANSMRDSSMESSSTTSSMSRSNDVKEKVQINYESKQEQPQFKPFSPSEDNACGLTVSQNYIFGPLALELQPVYIDPFERLPTANPNLKRTVDTWIQYNARRGHHTSWTQRIIGSEAQRKLKFEMIKSASRNGGEEPATQIAHIQHWDSEYY